MVEKHMFRRLDPRFLTARGFMSVPPYPEFVIQDSTKTQPGLGMKRLVDASIETAFKTLSHPAWQGGRTQKKPKI